MPNLQQLRYFFKTVEKGSVNKAAKELFISQPALTKQISLLEQKLETTLLIRNSNGIKITEAGQYLFDKLKLTLNTLDEIFVETKEIAKQKVLRIAALPSLVTHYLPTVLRCSSELHSTKIQLSVKDTTHELITLLKEDEVDIILVQDYVRQKES